MQALADIGSFLDAHPELVAEECTVKRGECLCRPGQTNAPLYYVKSGVILAKYQTADEDHAIRFGYKGSIITALDAHLQGTPSEFYLEAIKKSVVKVIPRAGFMKMINDSPDLQRAYVGLLENLVVQQLEREVDLLTTSPSQRYERVLKRSPQLFQEVPHKYIASYLRMTPETLSRLQKS